MSPFSDEHYRAITAVSADLTAIINQPNTSSYATKAAMDALPDNQRQRLHYLPPSADRWKLRSTTFKGIAEAMAEQWGVRELSSKEAQRD